MPTQPQLPIDEYLMMSKSTPTKPLEAVTDRANEMLRAATALFLERGYTAVSIDAVMARAGGSKRDLYQTFGDKEGLFRHVIAYVCDEIMQPLKVVKYADGSLHEALTSFGTTFLTFLLTPQVIALQKLVVSESGRHPEFAKAFVKLGPERAYQTMEGLLMRWSNTGEAVLRSPRVAAALFCDMLISDLQFRILAGGEVSAAEVEERVSVAVSIFLNGVMLSRQTA